MKVVVFLGDGMADRPVPELGNKTPLEAANHPFMDRMAQEGEYGMVLNVPVGMKPGSDTANLAVMGYDPKVYYSGRSPLEAASIGIELDQQDVTYRCNFVTLSGDPFAEGTTMVDYSAGEISSQEAKQLVEVMNRHFGSEHCQLYAGVSYRNCLVLRHDTEGAELTPPHDISKQSVQGHLPEGEHAALLREMMAYSYEVLKDHPVNQARVAAGKNPANCVWFWGEGRRPALRPFRELYGMEGGVISAVDLIQGIGKCAGMRVIQVEGATGTYKTNFTGKGQAAIEAFRTGCDFVYIHMEAPDECGHQCQINEKVYSIEQIDQKVVAPVLQYLEGTGEDYAALLLPDHPTPLHIMTHTSDPIPYVLYRKGDHAGRKDTRYTEPEAERTGIYEPHGYKMLSRILQGRQ